MTLKGRIAALGPEGTFSHDIAERLAPGQAILLPSIRKVVAAVQESSMESPSSHVVSYGVVPLENSEAGGVGATLDALIRSRVSIIGEIYFPVHHHLASRSAPGGIRTLYAHPETLEQCSEFVETLDVVVVPTPSNAVSALRARDDPVGGAIVPERAAMIYGIPIVRERVENSSSNVTRFVVIAPSPLDERDPAKCSIIIDPTTDRTGLLYEILAPLARRGINLTRIESRPCGRGIGRYLFFIDFAPSPGWDEALAEIRSMAHVRHLGCYRKWEVP